MPVNKYRQLGRMEAMETYVACSGGKGGCACDGHGQAELSDDAGEHGEGCDREGDRDEEPKQPEREIVAVDILQ